MFYANRLYINYHFICIQLFSYAFALLLRMGQRSRRYIHNLSTPSQNYITTDAKLHQLFRKLFIMSENKII